MRPSGVVQRGDGTPAGLMIARLSIGGIPGPSVRYTSMISSSVRVRTFSVAGLSKAWLKLQPQPTGVAKPPARRAISSLPPSCPASALPRRSVPTGASKACTGSLMSSSRKINRGCDADTAHRTWRSFAALPTISCAQGAAINPSKSPAKPPDGTPPSSLHSSNPKSVNLDTLPCSLSHLYLQICLLI